VSSDYHPCAPLNHDPFFSRCFNHIPTHSRSYTPTRLPPVPNVAAGSSTAHTTYDPPKHSLYSSSTAGTSTIGHYDPYAPPRRPSGPLPSSSSSSQKVPGNFLKRAISLFILILSAGIRFKDSPFFAIDQAVTSVTECPGRYLFQNKFLTFSPYWTESTSATDRRQQSLSFTLNNDQINKLKTPGSLNFFNGSSFPYSTF